MLTNMYLMNKLMLSCVKATELMEMKEHVPLGFLKTMQLHMHTAMCSGCKNYSKQTALINKVLNKTFNTIPEADTTTLEEKITSKII